MNDQTVTDVINWLRAELPLSAHLTSDSRQVEAGDVFIAYPGERYDGRQFIDAAKSSAAAAVLFDPVDGFVAPEDIRGLAVSDLKKKAGHIASAWYGDPSQRLFSIGVTGTSGKSTCALWLAQLFEALGHRAALIGTLGAGMLDSLKDTGHTTPDPVGLQRLLARLVRQGANVMAMEATSVGLVEGRVNGLHFDVVLFTNLSRDHLDYHGSMERYRDAKALLFGWPNLLAGVVNLDDAAAPSMRRAMAAGVEQITFSANGNQRADVYASRMEFLPHGMRLTIGGRFGATEVEAPVVGRFNVDNLLGVMAVALASGVDFDSLRQGVAQLRAAPGRLEPVHFGAEPIAAPLVLVDYAHKPDALEKVLEACRPMVAQRGGRLIAVFGCGGDRDRGKRPMMGEIASRLADHVVLTSDNPRSEVPETILEEIFAGVPPSLAIKVERLADRRVAIASTLRHAHPSDVIVIAGKGHEDYQEAKGIKSPFSDVAEARAALQRRAEVAAC
jgi:UDP-N-acetylmuramoyl-L-alanyl-D-glutamate--2,6-diaminopimelate ligase